MTENSAGLDIITRSEWNAKHSDFKLEASESQSGMPMMLKFIDGLGTCLVPVEIVPG
jgi:hypothetical protein